MDLSKILFRKRKGLFGNKLIFCVNMIEETKIPFVKVAIPLILASITIMLPHGIFTPLESLAIWVGIKPIQNFLTGFTQKIQIADIVFLIVLIPIVVKFISEKRHIYWSPFIKPIVAYAAVAFLSIFVSVSTKTTIVEFIGFSYLVV
ncbi:MAG: hypothetical protein AB1488_08155, partial [Nitrospirota bacterium]